MSRFITAALLVVAAVAGAGAAQDKSAQRIKDLEAEIANHEAKIAKLKAELASLQPKNLIPRSSLRLLLPTTFEVGQMGFLSRARGLELSYKVEEVIDGKTMIVQLYSALRMPFIVRGLSTANIVEDKEITLPGVWEVKEVEKRSGRSYFVARPIPFDRVAPEDPPAKKPIPKDDPKPKDSPKPAPEIANHSPLSLSREAGKLKSARVRVDGIAVVEPLAKGRYALRFWDAEKDRRLVVVYIEADAAGPLKATEQSPWQVTVEATVVGVEGGVVSLREAKITKAESKQ